MDLVVQVGRVETSSLGLVRGEASAPVRERVEAAVLRRDGIALGPDARAMIIRALESALVTARGAARIGAVARTVAALAGPEPAGEEQVAEALALRGEW
jgi:predicted ATPase with chaperone activity